MDNLAPTTRTDDGKTTRRTHEHKTEKQHHGAIHYGYITVPYGPHNNTDKHGWHYPGGGFTTSSRTARQWAWELDALYMQLLERKEACRAIR